MVVSTKEISVISASYQAIIQSLPKHLRAFAVDQHYERYTSIDQAVWRFVMRRNIAYFQGAAHPSYEKGLKACNMSAEQIPSIEELNSGLAHLGWKAICVAGFVPPAVFMELQEHGILPISAEMRTLSHLLYTPAPDIIHEAAGHLPFLVEPEYAAFLKRVGVVGRKALFTQQDSAVYEAIRHLSIIKEYPDATTAQVQEAEKALHEAIAANTEVSEATLVSRFHWWTVEYGLIESGLNWRIFGAGLLSSCGESAHCKKASVAKIPLSLACTDYAYDITKEQPQLFVARSFKHLDEVLEQLSATLAFRTGNLDKAIACQQICTAEFDTGLQVSGKFVASVPGLLKVEGPACLSLHGKAIPQQGTERHAHGFSMPYGPLAEGQNLANLATGRRLSVTFASGLHLSGYVDKIVHHNHSPLVVTLSEARLELGSTLLFDPAWGPFDWAIGHHITSVFAGSADSESWCLHKAPSQETALASSKNPAETAFAEVRRQRLSQQIDASILQNLASKHADNWLLLAEIYELLPTPAIEKSLQALSSQDKDTAELIAASFTLLKDNHATRN